MLLAPSSINSAMVKSSAVYVLVEKYLSIATMISNTVAILLLI